MTDADAPTTVCRHCGEADNFVRIVESLDREWGYPGADGRWVTERTKGDRFEVLSVECAVCHHELPVPDGG